MKKSLLLFILVLNSVFLFSQVIRDHRTGNPKPGNVKPVNENIKPVPVTQVTFYEHANYSGNSKSFAPGEYRLTGAADFNDMYSSVKVPAGMGVYIYEHADEKGGYGHLTDLLEDVPDLSVYDLNDKVSYINVFTTTNPNGFVWVRGRNANGQFVAGHWERKKANGSLPDNRPPAVVSEQPSRTLPVDDIAFAPPATQAEIDELTDVLNNQMGVAVLGGETTKPFYYHHNQSGESVYKYNKIIDPAYLPGAFFDWLENKMGSFGFVVKPVEVITDLANDIKDFFFGSSSTKMQIDCWYPVSEFKQTVCGKLKEDAFLCPQNYLHTKVTIDKDVCYGLIPSPRFASLLTNRWTGETHESIEGEVKPVLLSNYNTSTGKTTETTTPRNPILMQVVENENVCFHGPWVGDILDLNFKVPVPLTSSSIDLGNIDLRKANEIHPMNQIWRKKGAETILTAVVDGTGYFQKIGNGEIAASGLYQRMRFYMAFLIPPTDNKLTGKLTYDVNGIGFDFTDIPPNDVNPERITLKQNGQERIIINDNTVLRNQRTHKVFFEKVRKRPNGAIQGYIVFETEPINKQGGSINIFVKNVTVNNSPVGPNVPFNAND
jgi:hypothetical protein